MDEGEMGGVQSLAVEARKLLANRFRQLAQLRFEALTVKRVADQGVPDMGEVDAHLVGAPGLEGAFDERGERSLAPFAATEGLKHAPMSHGLAALPREHRHLGAARGMAADRGIDDASPP